jgi:predicted amidohydrolase YtcJ
VHDFGITGISAEQGLQLYTDLAAAGQLPMRVQASYYWNDPTIDPLPQLRNLSEQFSSDLVKVETLKINVDGGDDKANALYVDGYTDNPDLVVNPIIPFDVINDAVKRADAAGFNIACHCFGDLAVHGMLDAIEAAIATNTGWDRRHKISHATLVHPDDVARFAELGVTYDTSGTWMSLDPLLQGLSTQRLGRDRVEAFFPMKAIADAGGNVSLGSDWPVSGYISEYRPLVAIRTAVTRQLPGRDDQPPLGGYDARVPLAMAIRANTLGAAYGMGMDDRIGSIEVGKRADLIVLDRNLFEIDAHDIHTVSVLYTLMNGDLVYEAAVDD